MEVLGEGTSLHRGRRIKRETRGGGGGVEEEGAGEPGVVGGLETRSSQLWPVRGGERLWHVRGGHRGSLGS